MRVNAEISNMYNRRIALTLLRCWKSKKASAVPALTLPFVLVQVYVQSCGEQIGQLIVSKLTRGRGGISKYAAFPVQFFAQLHTCVCLHRKRMVQERR